MWSSLLAEPDPGVDGEPVRADPGEHGSLHAFTQVLVHLGHHVVVAGVVLHRLRLTEHVHQHEPGAAVPDDPEHGGSLPPPTSFTTSAPAAIAGAATAACRVSTLIEVSGRAARRPSIDRR